MEIAFIHPCSMHVNFSTRVEQDFSGIVNEWSEIVFAELNRIYSWDEKFFVNEQPLASKRYSSFS